MPLLGRFLCDRLHRRLPIAERKLTSVWPDPTCDPPWVDFITSLPNDALIDLSPLTAAAAAAAPTPSPSLTLYRDELSNLSPVIARTFSEHSAGLWGP